MFTLDYEAMMPELIAALGELALASRLRRLSDLLSQDVSRIYHEQGLEFEPRWFLLFYELDRSGPLEATELADRIGLSRAAVKDVMTELVRKGLLRSSGRPGSRELDLSTKGRRMVAKLKPIWQEIRRATAAFLAESGPGLLAELEQCEQAIRRRSMYLRVSDRIGRRRLADVKIVPYCRRHRDAFRALNLEWLEQFFTVEPVDRAVLDDPEREIIRKGGEVLFARVDGDVVGTCALVRLDRRRFELTKLAVGAPFRGGHVGRKLALAAIDRARRRGACELVARSNPRLEAANRLYSSLGFECVGADDSGKYSRPTILYRLALKPGAAEVKRRDKADGRRARPSGKR